MPQLTQCHPRASSTRGSQPTNTSSVRSRHEGLNSSTRPNFHLRGHRFQLPLTCNRRIRIISLFKIDKPVDPISGGEPRVPPCPMLIHSLRQITSHADVQSPGLACEDVDVVGAHHTPILWELCLNANVVVATSAKVGGD